MTTPETGDAHTPAQNSQTKKLDSPTPLQNRAASRSFWATIIVLATATIGLIIASAIRAPNSDSEPPTSREIPETILEGMFTDANKESLKAVVAEIDPALLDVYAPVYAAIPIYVDFHYSVLGEYTELTEAVRRQAGNSLYEHLFNGFGERLEDAGSKLDQQYVDAYKKSLENQIKREFPSESTQLPPGKITEMTLQKMMDRARYTVPLATTAATIVGSGALKKITAGMASKLAVKIAAKASAKAAAKGGSALAGAGTGVLVCAWSGPVAVICGVGGGIAAWLFVDAVVINLDEYFNRSEFEKDIRAMIDEDRAEKELFFEKALQKKGLEMDDFTMKSLQSGENKN